MTSPAIRRGKNSKGGKSIKPPLSLSVPLIPRRLAAWTLEVSLLAVSALVPYGIGFYIESQSPSKQVPLNSGLVEVKRAIADALYLPEQPEPKPVSPWTNLLWWVAIAAPVGLNAGQIYLLGKRGQTSPKRWLGVKVVTASSRSPGLLRALIREGLGKWGIPTGTAYLIWRYSAFFPQVNILSGLVGVMVLVGTGMAIFGSRRRTFHDRLAGTLVVEVKPSLVNKAGERQNISSIPEQLSNSNGTAQTMKTTTLSAPEKMGTTTILVSSSGKQLSLWQWMRQHPETTLLTLTVAGMISVMGTFVVTQIYIQSKTDKRQFQQQNNEVFLALVNQLSVTSANPLEERRSVIFALARLEDPRSLPLLVDLLGQETNPVLIETIQQALASAGPRALPDLGRLNQSLYSDLKALPEQDNSPEQQLIALRLRGTKQAIAKLLNLYSGQLQGASLERTDLSTVTQEPSQFLLVLDRLDLSGVNFRDAVMNDASLQGTRFYQVGPDGRQHTGDDRTADFSGADLNGANLTEAILTQARLNRTYLMGAKLNRADLANAQLNHANLSSAQLIDANLPRASLENASLTGADLGTANFDGANLQGARLRQVRAVGANFSGAKLSQVNWQGAELGAANFSKAHLQQADLSFTQLKGANFRDAQLQNASFRGANLSTADLRGANLAGADFQDATLAVAKSASSEQFVEVVPAAKLSTKITGVDFTEAKNLSPKQIEFICNQGGIHPQCSPAK